MKKKLTINWDDQVNQSATNSFTVIGTDIDTDVLMNGLAAISDCGIKSFSVSETYERGVDAEAGAAVPNTDPTANTADQKLVYTYLEDDGAELKSHTIEIPGPKMSIFENVLNQGKRLLQPIGASLAQTLEDATGHPCSYKEGWYKSDK